jgi:4-hydroxy-2-oxoheptanedioate aldolase
MPIELPVNRFKQQIAQGHAQIGLWLGWASPYTAEALAGCGFDWLLIDGEHAPNTVASTLSQLQAIAPYPVQPVARLVEGDAALIKQYLDIGVQTLLIPMVESAEQAKYLVEAMRYPPDGIRGVAGATRATRWNQIENYVLKANAEVCLLVQVETVAGLSQLAEIAAVDGVDGIFFGPSDLSASMGFPGQLEHPDVRHAIFEGIKTVLAANKAPGILSAKPAAAKEYLDAGCLFVAVGIDTMLLMNAARELAGVFKGIAKKP